MICPGPICCTTILSRASLSLSDGGAEASIDHEREIMAVSDAVGARDGMEVVGTVVGSMPDILLEMTSSSEAIFSKHDVPGASPKQPVASFANDIVVDRKGGNRFE